MVRTQIQLTKDQYRGLKERARRDGLSLSAAVRTAVDRWLQHDERSAAAERSLASIGRFRSGRKDVAERHDEHLAEIHAKRRGGK